MVVAPARHVLHGGVHVFEGDTIMVERQIGMCGITQKCRHGCRVSCCDRDGKVRSVSCYLGAISEAALAVICS